MGDGQSKRSCYSLEDDLRPIIDGKAELPNFKEVPLEEGVARLHFYYGGSIHKGHARVPGDTSAHGEWAMYFLNNTQAGNLDGSGYVAWSKWEYDPAKNNGRSVGHMATFAICQHEKKESPDARPMRGWHPGFCTKCGLDMTVDSGD
jgi:hypothetical protein